MSKSRDSRMIKCLINTSRKIWEGFLQNIGIYFLVFILSGGYLVALNKIKAFQDAVRQIPTDWVLTPFVLILIILGVLIKINLKQKQRIIKLEREPLKDERDARFVTHFGLWWKIFFDSEYIEDFPYCTCCDPKMKLGQIEWHPDEVYQCPQTKAQFKLFDEIPRKRNKILRVLYTIYFKGFGNRFRERFYNERSLLKKLNPDISNDELFDKLFQMSPLDKLPREELVKIRGRYPKPTQAFFFVEQHFSKYKRYFKSKPETSSD